MSISKSFNKQNGVTYVYEVTENYWDKEKKRPKTKRKLIGKIDPETNEIVPTSRKRKPAYHSDGEDYRILYESAITDSAKKEESLLKFKGELESAFMDEQTRLAEIERKVLEMKKNLDCLLRMVKNYG